MSDLQSARIRNFPHDAFDECRLAFAVFSHKGNFLAAPNSHVHTRENKSPSSCLTLQGSRSWRRCTFSYLLSVFLLMGESRGGDRVNLAEIFCYNGEIAGPQARGKFQMHRLIVYFIYLQGHDLGQLLDATLYLHRLCGLIAKSLYELFHVGNLLLLVLVSPQLLLTPLGS